MIRIEVAFRLAGKTYGKKHPYNVLIVEVERESDEDLKIALIRCGPMLHYQNFIGKEVEVKDIKIVGKRVL